MNKPRALSVIAVFCFSILIAACGGDYHDPTFSELSLQEQYENAVIDASIAEASEIWRFLTPINNDNPNLIWENGVVGSRLLVVTWIGNVGEYYKCNDPGGCDGNTECIEGGECPTYRWDTWVTLVPELRNFFSMKEPEPLRIAQLLGLPPESAVAGNPKEYKYMLELWVSPQDLFRPCPDTEISDTVCEISFPIDSFSMLDPNDMAMVTVGPEYGTFMTYYDWFNNQANYSYIPDYSSYPWTRLGYTYDWGSSPPIGLSEFVLHGNKEDGSTISVGINSVKSTAEYFRE